MYEEVKVVVFGEAPTSDYVPESVSFWEKKLSEENFTLTFGTRGK